MPSIGTIAGWYNIAKRKYNDWIIRVIIASDSKTTQSGGDNRKKFPLGAALQVTQIFSFAQL